MVSLLPTPPTEGAQQELEDKDKAWLEIARNSYQSSTDWLDINLRGQWERNLSNFNSRHPAGSKYNTEAFSKRSRLFRPKTRTTVRKLEAAMTTAFFTNEDVVSIQPNDINNPDQVLSASVMFSVIQYRLTHTIPWFKVMVGAIQSAAVSGVAIAHIYWDYKTRKEKVPMYNENGEMMFSEEGPMLDTIETTMDDKPVISLVAPENFRIDPSADWTDPVGSSPYVIELIPMYVQDVMERMDGSKNGWIKIPKEQLMTGIKQSNDTVRQARDKGRTDRYDDAKKIVRDHDIVWVHKNIIRKNGVDWCYYTLGTELLLSKPKKLNKMYPHLKERERPYVMGMVNLESFRVYPSGTVELSQELQAASNEIWNQRFENIKLAMNKRYHTRRDANIDYGSLFRNVAGGVVEMDEPDRDVKVVETRDVTGSAYAEQDRINMDFDELQGNFSASTVAGARNLNETVGGMSMLAGNTNMITEFALRTFGETFVEPVLKQFMRIEQFYENDVAIINLHGQAAEAFPRGGTSQEIDELMRHELTLKVNVGLNATDPIRKVNNLMMFSERVAALVGPQALNITEVIKEMASGLGFKGGERFIAGDDPRITQLEEKINELQQIIETKRIESEGRLALQEAKSRSASEVAQIRGQVEMAKAERVYQLGMLELAIKESDSETKRGELILQRDALLKDILSEERDFNAGKVGTMSRDDYGSVPYAVG